MSARPVKDTRSLFNPQLGLHCNLTVSRVLSQGLSARAGGWVTEGKPDLEEKHRGSDRSNAAGPGTPRWSFKSDPTRGSFKGRLHRRVQEEQRSGGLEGYRFIVRVQSGAFDPK